MLCKQYMLKQQQHEWGDVAFSSFTSGHDASYFLLFIRVKNVIQMMPPFGIAFWSTRDAHMLIVGRAHNGNVM